MTESKSELTAQDLCRLSSGNTTSDFKLFPNPSGELTFYGKDGELYVIASRRLFKGSAFEYKFEDYYTKDNFVVQV